jgi:hypothetical protein
VIQIEPQIDMALAAIGVLTAKHFLSDFILQTNWIAANKGRYGHVAGLLHAFGHVLLTPLVFLVIAPASMAFAGALLCAEFVWHYHQDWLKDRVTNALGLTPADTGFWWTLGLDQGLHQATYIVIVYLLLKPPFA